MNGATLLSTFINAGNGTTPVTPSPLRVALSGVSSSTSLACWIVLLLPQLIEQWKVKSSDGISLGFIVIWFIGDLANLIGSLWANLLPGVILLAVWFCFADGLLITSYIYYQNLNKKLVNGHGPRHKHRHGSASSATSAGGSQNDPTQPLLNGRRRGSSNGRRKSSLRRRRDSLTSIVDAPVTAKGSILTQYVLPLVFVFAAGLVGYFFSSGEVPEPPTDDDDGLATGPLVLGYLSAALYLGARIPQIYQNHKKRSVEGLSLLFFIFAMLGNITYSGGILFYRSDLHYIVLYLPWLLGSLGTIFEDIIIMIQFYVYNTARGSDSAIVD